MINLLSPVEKHAIQKEEKYRLIFTLGVFVLFFLATFSLILFSVRIYISGQAESQRILLNLEQQKSKTLEVQDIEREIKLINQNLSNLSSFYDRQPNLTELLGKISYIVSVDMYLNSMSLKPNGGDGDKFQVSLTGYSPTREILLDFKKKLEVEPDFQGIYFPPSNWVKPVDINFSATFEITI